MWAGQRQCAGKKSHDRVAAPGLDCKSRHGRLGQCDQAHVQRSIHQPGQGFLRGQHGHLHVDAGVALAQYCQRLRQQMRNRPGGCTQAHAPCQALHLPLDVVKGALRVGQ